MDTDLTGFRRKLSEVEQTVSTPAPTWTRLSHDKSVTLELLWKEYGFSPNREQERAITITSGPLYITAGPGSGKTSVLVWRTLNLIVFHNVPPEQILLGTFTEKGAHQLRERLRGLLALASAKTSRPYDISKMAIGTIHSICRKLLLDRRLHPDGGRPRAPVLLDAFAQYQFVYAARNWTLLLEEGQLTNSGITQYFEGRNSSSRHRAVVNAISFFNRMSEEAIDDERRPDDETLQGLLRMYAAYRGLLSRDPNRALTDLSLLQYHAYRCISESSHGGSIFQHVIVDEYQDTNAIQEKIYFRLAANSKNLCVVGDDDQALYRFRGGTVDNFLAFPGRCKTLLNTAERQVRLEINYRSRKNIVSFCNAFIDQFEWSSGGRCFRVAKKMEANSADPAPAVFHATPESPERVASEVAAVVKRLIDEGRVNDPNQVAFLFPSLAARCVSVMKKALERRGLKVYAPRAGSFIEQPESLKVFGTYLLIFDSPGHRHGQYSAWLDRAVGSAQELVAKDRSLAKFVGDRRAQIQQVLADENALLAALTAARLDEQDEYGDSVARAFQRAQGVSREVQSFLSSGRLSNYIREQRKRRPDRPITARYVINRACSLDWGILDLFYQLTAFDSFKEAFDVAESRIDEGPICNLSLISDYLARFQEQTSPVISAQFLAGSKYVRKLFSSYVYSIFRLEQGEYEDKEDPFPKGRIPFLTIHQAKGLEFPVVVLGNLRKDATTRNIDTIVDSLGVAKIEPLGLAPTFDVARMFYVALSRAKRVLILCPFKGRGQRFREEFKAPIKELSRPLDQLEASAIEPYETETSENPRPFSFTGDYIQYSICPRRYMLYRRYNFVPSRSQTTMFGNLVHRTIEDLHQYLIRQKASEAPQ